MRKITNYKIEKESINDMCKARRFNPCLEITFRDKTGQHTHKLSAGHSDNLFVYREWNETYILSQNNNLGYIGFEVFIGSEKKGDVFLQGDQVNEVLGRDDLAPFTIIRRLREYVNP